jgi:putative transcriptional regulator
MRKTRSAILEAVHETAKGLHAAGALEQVTLREFDRLCWATKIRPAARQDQKDSRAVSCQPAEFFSTLLGDNGLPLPLMIEWE